MTEIPAHSQPSTLVLWDIDHTLLESRGVGGALFAQTFQEVTGRPMQHSTPLAGKTEPVLINETLTLHGIEPTEQLLEAFFDTLANHYDAAGDRLATQGRALPGAAKAMKTLAERSDIANSVLTGNLRRVAVTKLTAFELDPYVDFDIGAYGSDDANRTRLVAIAQNRATTKLGLTPTASSTILIGDTPNDVTAALTAGAHIIGVATGRHTTTELTQAGAPIVLTDLTDLELLLQAIASS